MKIFTSITLSDYLSLFIANDGLQGLKASISHMTSKKIKFQILKDFFLSMTLQWYETESEGEIFIVQNLNLYYRISRYCYIQRFLLTQKRHLLWEQLTDALQVAHAKFELVPLPNFASNWLCILTDLFWIELLHIYLNQNIYIVTITH